MNEATTIRFVELYRSEECLWNPFHPDYKYKGARWKAADRIANKLNVYGFGPTEVTQKFKNIRSSYCQELKKIHFSVQQGMEVYKPKVVWFHIVDQFLKPYVAVQLDNKETQNHGSQQQPKQPAKQIEEDTNGEMIEINDDELVKVEPHFHFDTINNNCEFYNGKPAQRAQFIVKLERPTCDSPDPVNKQKMETPEYITSKPLDEYDAFGRFISCQLREFPKDYAARVESKLLQCLSDERVNFLKDRTSDRPE
ncbi:hypothetical protein MML48_3g00008368 [Holotrichia oblita]|uniref:Uncharacterized protein n=3 Tax=Holotrichia oblita TaxID=644536 RepID=A0ACB9TEX2_HOLOL|nr:hypothetical protein MML48_7g00001399 [Holotrichia oblita]KAI4458394.1 hypothetical protein MML48_7g00010287 [Holotrichia oblita]KAI4465342.1 hypothetical protein MML48_3g00008368 [Holotrichia oblita]